MIGWKTPSRQTVGCLFWKKAAKDGLVFLLFFKKGVEICLDREKIP